MSLTCRKAAQRTFTDGTATKAKPRGVPFRVLPLSWVHGSPGPQHTTRLLVVMLLLKRVTRWPSPFHHNPGAGTKFSMAAMSTYVRQNQTQAAPQLHCSLQQTLQEAVQVPPTGNLLGPKVEHVQLTDDGQLSVMVAAALQLPHQYVLELLRFGAVHYCPVMPEPGDKARACLTEQKIAHILQIRATAINKWGRNPKLQHPRRLSEDVHATAGGYVRVHVHPKRFPAAYSVDWSQHIIHDHPEYVVVDKPAGVQVCI